MNKIKRILPIVVISLIGCTESGIPDGQISTEPQPPRIKPISNTKNFDGKAPQALLEDADIGGLLRQMIPAEKMACVLEIFNYMPDLSVSEEGRISGELLGSRADAFKEAALSVLPSGEMDLIVNCDFENKGGQPFYYYTNRPNSSGNSADIINWVEAWLSPTLGRPTITIAKIAEGVQTDYDYKQFLASDSQGVLASQSSPSSAGIRSYRCISKKYNMREVNFSTLAVDYPKDELQEAQACEAIEKILSNQLNSAEDAMENLCTRAEKDAEQHGGLRNAIKTLESGDGRTRFPGIYNTFKMCSDRKMQEEAIASQFNAVSIRPFSVGSFKKTGLFGSTSCTGILVELNTGNSNIYYLAGTGKCSDFKSDEYQAETSGGKNVEMVGHGNFIRDNLEYTGIIPEYFIRRGSQYKFVTPRSEARPANTNNNDAQNTRFNQRSTPTPNSQPSETFGKRYANQAASIVERGNHPVCRQLAHTIRSFGSSGQPDYVIQRQVDSVIDSQATNLCIN